MYARSALLIGLAVITACDLKRQPTDLPDSPIAQIVVRPDSVMLDPQQTQSFRAYGLTAAGDSVPATVSWSATGGSITSSGLYTADTSANDGTVTATLSSAPVNGAGHVKKRRLVQVVVTPTNANLQAGQSQQFSAYGRRNTGDSVAVNVTYSATGGTITSSGMYTAGNTSGTFRVIVRESATSLQDTSAVSVTSAPPPPPAPVATVTVTPASSNLGIGQTLQLVATLKDSAGNTLTGRSVAWSSGAPLLASVNGGGLVSGLVAGLVPITATSEGKSGSSSITVVALPPPPTNLFPNEPSGMTLIQESTWETGLLGSWFRKFTSTDKPITIVPITDSPLGEGQALEIGYLAGHQGGGGTELEYDIPTLLQPREMFVGYYVQVSSNWQGHSSAINKMVYLDDGGASFSAMWYEMFGSGSQPLGLYVVNQSGSGPAGIHENVQAVNFTRGVWHKVEIYQKQGSPGIVRVWVDGVLAIDRSDVFTRDAAIGMVTISGIWGGIGDTKAHFDYMRFDHIRISGR